MQVAHRPSEVALQRAKRYVCYNRQALVGVFCNDFFRLSINILKVKKSPKRSPRRKKELSKESQQKMWKCLACQRVAVMQSKYHKKMLFQKNKIRSSIKIEGNQQVMCLLKCLLRETPGLLAQGIDWGYSNAI